MVCSACGVEALGAFCENCGRGLRAIAAQATTPAEPGIRAAGYVIDAIPAIVIGLMFGWIPVLGAMIAGFFLFLYWFFRDVAGASIGKLILGLKVAKQDGTKSGMKERLLRNLPIAGAVGLLMIPVAGYVIAPVVASLVIITEAVLLLSTKQRLGDRMAGSSVVRKL